KIWNLIQINKMVQLAKMVRSSYYHIVSSWKQTYPDRKWKRRIKFIYNKHKGHYGYRRITYVLQEKGYYINKTKVLRLMRELGIQSIVRMTIYKSYKVAISKEVTNILDHKFE